MFLSLSLPLCLKKSINISSVRIKKKKEKKGIIDSDQI